MQIYTDIVEDYLQGKSLAAHEKEWFFLQPGYRFEAPDCSEAQKAAVREVYGQTLRSVQKFVPGNRAVWDALFPDWQAILDQTRVALIIGYPEPNDALVMKDRRARTPPFWTWDCGRSIWGTFPWGHWPTTC